MVRKWITLVNYSACSIIALLLLGALYFFITTQTTFSLSDSAARKSVIPKGAFVRAPHEYESIGAPVLALEFSPLSVQLPDLRRYLVFYGKNGRPDANQESPALYFTFTGNKSPMSALPGERLYVLYDKKQTPNQYVFSTDNAPAALWIEANAQGNQAAVKVSMKTESGAVVTEPAAYAEFLLPEKEFVRFGGNVWELGKWRVDGTLLARQKTRWYGLDKFLEKHGGPEYKDWQNKQRIDFGEGDEIYSVYVGTGDCLIWVDNTWQTVKVGDASLKYTLMCIKKVDERVMNLELWDVGGKGKVSLNLVKANEAWLPQNLEQNFKFVGARTRSQFVFEVNNARMLVSPHDWLLLTEGGWKKLSSPKDIDDYVERRKVGPLFVFDRVDRKDERQIIIGTLFNAARTEMVTVELPLQQGAGGAGGGKGRLEEKKQKVKETNAPPMVKTGSIQGEGASPARGLREGPPMRIVPDEEL